ncbi:hypothetical protein NP493_2114g00004 [Ridgeia piscesae]|uniref:Uncharacterized protein n=1 Tax=Ridgeia piscesae TaxID=27915 RepID=A0AAD9N4V1_RIDPI|nr:hypothetical protein NP493_2114g00004 [Ridgeia piscesae]
MVVETSILAARSGGGLSGQETKRLATDLSQLTRLESLTLDGNNFGEATTGAALVESVSKMKSLRTLRFR